MSNECYSILSGRPLTLHEHPRPAARGSWGVPLYPADFGLRIEPEASRFYGPTLTPLDHVGDVLSVNVRLYIIQATRKPTGQPVLQQRGAGTGERFKVIRPVHAPLF